MNVFCHGWGLLKNKIPQLFFGRKISRFIWPSLNNSERNTFENYRVPTYFKSTTSQNGQIHLKNLAANATRFLKYIWPF